MICKKCKNLVVLEINISELPNLPKYKKHYYCMILNRHFYDDLPDIVSCNKYYIDKNKYEE
jgi:hypothetical protein